MKKMCLLLIFTFVLSATAWSDGAWSTGALVADSTLQSGSAEPAGESLEPTGRNPGPTGRIPGPTSGFPGPV